MYPAPLTLHGLTEYTNWQTMTLNKNASFGRGKASKVA